MVESYDTDWIRQNYDVIWIKEFPISKLWRMRKKASGTGEMGAKRTEQTMREIEEGFRYRKQFDPIIVKEADWKEGYLFDGKHRLIMAKKLKLKKYPVALVGD